MKSMSFTNRAIDEQSEYRLNQNPEYQAAIARYYDWAEKRFAITGSWGKNDIPTKNMLKALRMMPWQNSAEDWARLHVMEAANKLDRRSRR